MAGHTPWSEIRKKMTPEQIARSDAKAEALTVGMLINKLRKQSGLSQQELADKLGITQQAISKMEWGEEIQLSTLNHVIAALGGNVVVQMPGEEFSLTRLAAG